MGSRKPSKVVAKPKHTRKTPKPQPEHSPHLITNTFLVGINKGFIPASKEGEYPRQIKCWKKGCSKRLTVCGYPFYICDNNHAFDRKTGEKWNWVPTDVVYHPLLGEMDRVEKAYQTLFHPTSRLRSHTEAEQIFVDLEMKGRQLYDKLNIQEPNPYRWTKDSFKHHASMRLAIRLMDKAVLLRKKISIRQLNSLTPRAVKKLLTEPIASEQPTVKA